MIGIGEVMKNKTTVKVADDEQRPIEKNVLASAIVEMSAAVKKLQRGGLTFDAIVVLTHHNCKSPYKYGTKPGMSDVRAVLESVGELERRYAH